MDENGVGKASGYNFKYTSTYSPEQLKKMAEEEAGVIVWAKVGEYSDYFSMSTVLRWEKKPWVPFWLWKLVAYPTDWIGKENS